MINGDQRTDLSVLNRIDKDCILGRELRPFYCNLCDNVLLFLRGNDSVEFFDRTLKKDKQCFLFSYFLKTCNQKTQFSHKKRREKYIAGIYNKITVKN